MNSQLYSFLSLDLPALLSAISVSLSCALVGNFLVLKRDSLMGDAISHAVLPGIVVAFILTSSRSAWPVFLGAAAAALLATFLIGVVARVGKVDSGAAMGVVFSLFFALGVFLLEQAAAENVDLDAECLLHGQLETIFWYPPKNLSEWLSWRAAQLIPIELVISASVLFVLVAIICLVWKELTIFIFDPALCGVLGFSPRLLNSLLMTMVAMTAVSSFRIVGSILVIAMLICPPLAARFVANRMSGQLVWSLIFAFSSAVSGYFLAGFAPIWLPLSSSLNAAGFIALMSGVILVTAVMFAPELGWLPRKIRSLRLALDISCDDLLAQMYRAEASHVSGESDFRIFLPGRFLGAMAQWFCLRAGFVQRFEAECVLSPKGRKRAEELVRNHRLWESYLASEGGFPVSEVHSSAEHFEHYTDRDLGKKLADATEAAIDPHGSPIPKG